MAKPYRCPRCKKDSHIDVTITTDARLYQRNGEITGTDPQESQNGDHEWDEHSTMTCIECGYVGVAFEFDRDNEGEGYQKPPLQVWISKLIPRDGADTYECGVRVQASLSEEDCYRDLAEWLEIEYEGKYQVEAELGKAVDGEGDYEAEGFGVRTWNVEVQEIHG